MTQQEKYYLGLDIGTDSVGYAVTDPRYNLKKFRGEPAWGVTLFDAAAQAADRRAFRIARRRLNRRQQRVHLLQELFAAEIAKIDERFFIRQQESMLYPDDKQEPYTLFNDPSFNDADFHRRYPTIHHLIDELMYSAEVHDVRLVYLACAWLVAHRGHFLSQIDKQNIDAVTDFSAVYGEFRDYFTDQEYELPWSEETYPLIEEALRANRGVTKKYKALVQACFPGQKVPKDGREGFPYNCDLMLRALAGGKVPVSGLFQNDDYAENEIKKFSLDMDDETAEKLLAELGSDFELIVRMKAVYDWSLLVEVLSGKGREGNTTISKAKIAVYEQHQNDLKLLKYVIRKYAPDKFDKMFRDNTAGNYVSYSGHGGNSETKGTNQEEFCKSVRNALKGVVPDEADQPAFSAMTERLEANQFMPKQKSGNNRVIPYQLYWYEIDRILRQAEAYLPFLKERDDEGFTVSDKIRSVFTYRIPYFVGPLGGKGGEENHWAVRKKPGRILPWNFDGTIDLDASEEAFIKRMTNTCTYLPGEPVVPKDSLLYHRFTVLNEINNIRINGLPITVEQKQEIYRNVFSVHPRVRFRQLRDYMLSNGILRDGDEIAGIDTVIKSDLKPQCDFRALMESGVLSEADVEAIIERRTYSEEQNRFVRWLGRNYAALSAEDIRQISRLKYKDFGRLSRRFLTGFEGVNRETGEVTTIMQALWETNDNLMELLSERYTFREALDAEQREYYREHPKKVEERLKEMYVPAAVRRPVLRALDIVGEVVKAFGRAPERIFIEMARGGTPEQKGKRTLTRKSQLLDLYAKCRDEDVRLLTEQLEEMGDSADMRLQSEKLFLYYLQLGRCMYTGEAIDLSQLMNDKLYDVDHIYPQSLVKDDSILNNKVLVSTEENERKGNRLVRPDVQQKMLGLWEHLKSVGLIGDEKFRRLTRTKPFTTDEKWGFINRQITETSQSTLAVAELLKEKYPQSELVFVKARLAADFRQEFDRIKSRDYNDLHHAKDAYLNIVVGNVYHEKFSRRWFSPENEYTMNTKAVFSRPVKAGGDIIWDGTPMLEAVRAVLLKNNAHLTRYAYKRQGGLFKQQPCKKASGLIPLKKELSTEKYGGYTGSRVSYFVLTKYTNKKNGKSDMLFMPIEVMYLEQFNEGGDSRIEFA
ncbi:MAG: type II CRISPR RNA-guided endonuclease Cas9, partial [Lentisphaeria bacterium]|nr:type II CRISPR RNA-guided endonuclease Cas9 [Lentisphaeria bacterium]